MNNASVFVAAWLKALPFMTGLALLAWVVSTKRRNAGLVDIFWSLFILTCAIVVAATHLAPGVRPALTLAITAAWALRLAGFLAVRNWHAPEDGRYRAIRARNEPGFAWKSLYLVFGLQVVLAWLIAAPVAAAISIDRPTGAIDLAGAALAAFGIVYETVADAQLARFKADPTNAGSVMSCGLWRHTRHPNYFGEFCVWWGLYVIAFSSGAWWTVFSPLLMSLLLIRISGVTLLEKDIVERRPDYREYIARTRAFFPGPRR